MKLEIFKDNDSQGFLSLEDGKIIAEGNVSWLKNVLSHYIYLKDPEEILSFMSGHLRSYIWAKKV